MAGSMPTCWLSCQRAVSIDRVVWSWRRGAMSLKSEDRKEDEGRSSNSECGPHPAFTQEVKEIALLRSMDDQVAPKALPVAL